MNTSHYINVLPVLDRKLLLLTDRVLSSSLRSGWNFPLSDGESSPRLGFGTGGEGSIIMNDDACQPDCAAGDGRMDGATDCFQIERFILNR